jgi:hypothetical protein
MSKALADPVELIRRGAPRLIRSEEELAEYTRALLGLTAKPKPSSAEQEAINLLTFLIDATLSPKKPAPPKFCVCSSNVTVSPRPRSLLNLAARQSLRKSSEASASSLAATLLASASAFTSPPPSSSTRHPPFPCIAK